MTAVSVVRMTAVIGTLSGLALTVGGLALDPVRADHAAVITGSGAAGESRRAEPGNPDSIARAIARRNPFRADRGASRVPFDPATAGVAAPAPVATPAPVLIGVVGSESSRAAVIQGIPGVEGSRVLGSGERAGGYTVRVVYDDSAIVAGPDSLLHLRLRRGP